MTITIILIAIALAMDATAVSIASGAGQKHLQFKYLLIMAAVFGIFQAVMPLIGYLAGYGWLKYIGDSARWLSFAVLVIIGCKMAYDSFKVEKAVQNITRINILLILAFATSIDALSVGFSLSVISKHIFLDTAVIGIITFLLSAAGAYFGKKLSSLLSNKAEILSGIILIVIGIKILISPNNSI